MVAPPLLSVIIPTYNRRELLLETVRGLERQTLPPDQFEVVVVVDGSRDGSTAAVRALSTPFRCEVFEQKNAGPGAARNRGAAEASGEYLLFFADDIFLQPGALAAHVAALQRTDGGPVLGDLSTTQRSRGLPAYSLSIWDVTERLRTGNPPRPTDCYSNHLSISAALFAELGPFEGKYRRMEDTEFGFRAHNAGHHMGFAPDARGEHVVVKDSVSALRDWYDYGITSSQFLDDHPDLLSAITPARPAGVGKFRPALTLAAATIPLPPPVLRALGRIPLDAPGARRLFSAMHAHAYLRGVRSQRRQWDAWCAFINRAGGRLPD